jgi:hypothetical protein
MALNFGLQLSFYNMYNWKEIREKAEKVNSTKASIKMIRFLAVFLSGVTPVLMYKCSVIVERDGICSPDPDLLSRSELRFRTHSKVMERH